MANGGKLKKNFKKNEEEYGSFTLHVLGLCHVFRVYQSPITKIETILDISEQITFNIGIDHTGWKT